MSTNVLGKGQFRLPNFLEEIQLQLTRVISERIDVLRFGDALDQLAGLVEFGEDRSNSSIIRLGKNELFRCTDLIHFPDLSQLVVLFQFFLIATREKGR